MSVLRTIPGRRWLRFGVLFGLLLLVLVGCALPEEPEPEAADLGGDVDFTLRTSMEHGLAFVGVGGDIDGVVNPTLVVEPGDTVTITLINGDGMAHDLTVDAFGVTTGELSAKDSSATITFTVGEAGEFAYFCSVAGHRQAGMKVVIRVGEPVAETEGADSVHRPSDLPAPVGERGPELVQVTLTAVEMEGQLADGATYNYFT